LKIKTKKCKFRTKIRLKIPHWLLYLFWIYCSIVGQKVSKKINHFHSHATFSSFVNADHGPASFCFNAAKSAPYSPRTVGAGSNFLGTEVWILLVTNREESLKKFAIFTAKLSDPRWLTARTYRHAVRGSREGLVVTVTQVAQISEEQHRKPKCALGWFHKTKTTPWIKFWRRFYKFYDWNTVPAKNVLKNQLNRTPVT